MTVRTWHGIVPGGQAEAFRKHLLQTGVAEVKAITGNCGAYIHQQRQDDWEHFFMVSYWENYEAIRAFAGATPHIAVCYPGDAQYGLISDPIVLHHEVQAVPAGFPLGCYSGG